jgi:hypothetical protein
MKRKTMYCAEDGTSFETEDECLAYESQAAVRDSVERFLQSDLNQYKGAAHASIARRAILDYVVFTTAEATAAAKAEAAASTAKAASPEVKYETNAGSLPAATETKASTHGISKADPFSPSTPAETKSNPGKAKHEKVA